MIIKLAVYSNRKKYLSSLNEDERKDYKSIKNGAAVLGTFMATKNLTKIDKEINPKLGKVRQFMLAAKLTNPKSSDTIQVMKFTPIKAAKMGLLGAAAGGVLGLGLSRMNRKLKEQRNVTV